MAFWIVAGAMAVAVLAALGLGLRRGGGAMSSAAFDRQVYLGQLRDIARDAARGVIPAGEAERLRAEVGRRLLTADRAATVPEVSARGPAAVAVGLATLACGGAVAGYLWLGAPGYGDVPRAGRIAAAEALRAARPSQEAAETAQPAAPAPGADAEFLALMQTLRQKLAERPDDLQGHILLAENEAALGNFAAARKAQGEVIRLKGDAATADDLVQLARWMIAAAGGQISPEAETVLGEALRRDRDAPEALFMMGLSALRTGRPDLGFRYWRRFSEVAPADHPWRAQVLADLGSVAAAAGADWTPAPDVPDADAIRGMVEGLAARLAAEGGSAEEWAQLVRALGVLGETDRARAIWTEAQGVFADRPDDLALVKAAAEGAGVVE